MSQTSEQYNAVAEQYNAVVEQYIAVTDGDADDAVELPLEQDGALLLTTLCGQFPGASGLKFKPEGAKAFRGVRLDDGRLSQPADGWKDYTYSVVFPKETKENTKRKIADDRYIDDDDERNHSGGGAAKLKRVDLKKCTDLIVLGLPYKMTEKELREYFEEFGELSLLEIKKNNEGESKGFGFVRFSDYESQMKVLNKSHDIGGRKCEVKIPASKGDGPSPSRRIFVGRLPESATKEELREFFSQYGEIEDVYIPRPFRQFAFVTFVDAHVAPGLIGEEFKMNGTQITVSSALPKGMEKKESQYGTVGDGNSQYAYWPHSAMASSYSGGNYRYGLSQVSQGGGYGQGVGSTSSGFKPRDAYGPGSGGGSRGPAPGGGNLATGIGNLNLNSVNPDMLAAAHVALMTALQQQGGSGGGGSNMDGGQVGDDRRNAYGRGPANGKPAGPLPMGVGYANNYSNGYWGRGEEGSGESGWYN